MEMKIKTETQKRRLYQDMWSGLDRVVKRLNKRYGRKGYKFHVSEGDRNHTIYIGGEYEVRKFEVGVIQILDIDDWIGVRGGLELSSYGKSIKHYLENFSQKYNVRLCPANL